MSDPADQFDPSKYPDEFTPDYLGTLSIGDIELLEHNVDSLSARQKETFEAARDEVMAPINAAARAAARRLAGFKMPPVTVLSPDLKRAIDGLNGRFAAASLLAERSGYRQFSAPEPPAFNMIRTRDAMEDAPVSQVAREVEHDAELVTLVTSMLELMRRQYLASTRGAFFAIIVSMSVIVAGVAPIVAAEDAGERWSIMLISAGLGAVALVAYVATRWVQNRKDTPPTTPGS